MIIVLALLATLVGAVNSEHYHIVPVDSTALCQHYPNGTCFTLDQLSSQISHTGDITISFFPGEHLLTWNMRFINRNNITLNSEQLDNLSNSAPKITNVPNTGIDVIDTHIFTLKGLVIYGCRSGAIRILRTKAVVIKNSVFQNNSAVPVSVCATCFSSGALYSKNSFITIDSCVFNNNTGNGRGAVSIHTGTVHITNCTFENNQAVGNRINGGTGGVLYIAGSYGFVTNTVFKHNRATKGITGISGAGGALSVWHSGEVQIRNSIFEHNTALLGGAIHTQGRKVALFVTHSTLTYNQAYIGGAIYSLESKELTFLESPGPTRIKNNKASYGGGICCGLTKFNGHGSFSITNNSAKRGGGIAVSYGAIELLRNITVQIVGNTALLNGGGLYLAASTMTIDTSKQITIDSNIAHNHGGGFYFGDKSQLFIFNHLGDTGSYVIIYLRNNTAKRGGGIYVPDSGGQDQCSLADRERVHYCFMILPRHNFWQVILYFENNSAVETGSDIYGGFLDRCHVQDRTTLVGIEQLKGIARFSWAQTITNYTSNRTLSGVVTDTAQFLDHISSEPVRVCFCLDDVMNCSYTHPTVFKKKGKTFTLNVVAVDQVGRPLNATIISILPQSKDGRLKEGQQFRQVGDQCTELEHNVYSSETDAVLQLYADGPCTNLGISKQEVNIIFDRCTCPIGLQRIQDPIDCSCECTGQLTPYISNCSPKTGQIQVNENIWIKYINDTNLSTQFVTHDCPFDYCVQKPVNISLANQTETDRQCAFNRTGRLCGQCGQGLSLVFAISRCQQCSNNYLFLLLPFALAGIALVAFILLLNITVAAGTIHGLIFYGNILTANRSIFLPFETENFLTVFISWLSLDLGIETCFYNGMDSYGKFLLQLVFPAYVFVLITIIMVLCNCSQRIAGLFGKKNPEATLYTLLLLSYSKLIRIIITALQFAPMSYPDGQKLFWLYDANVPYFAVNHIPRFLVAFIIILLGAVYTTLLLFGQLFNRCSEYRLMKWTTHRYYIHFLKAHHAPLSDKHRYWVGLLLLARLVHYLISAFADDSVVILSVGLLAFVLLLFKQNKQIYNKAPNELLETLFITNIGVFALSTFYVEKSNRDTSYSQQSLAIVSMSVSFIAFLGIVLYHILDTCGVKLGEVPNKIFIKLRERQHYQSVSIIEEQSKDDDDELLIQLDEVYNYADNDTDDNVNDHNDPARYITPPIIRSAVPADQLREPALDDLIPVQPEDYNIPPAPRPQRREPTFTEIDIGAM